MSQRRYINQGLAGPKYSSLAVRQGISDRQTVVFYPEFKEVDVKSKSIVLDAEQVADLIAYLQQICPRAVKPIEKKIIDE